MRSARSPGPTQIAVQSAGTRGRRRCASRPRSRCSSAASSSASRIDRRKRLVHARSRDRRGDAGRLDLPGARDGVPRFLRPVSVRAIAPATRSSSRLRSALRRARAASIASGSCSRRARRWRSCASDSSRRASIFSAVEIGVVGHAEAVLVRRTVVISAALPPTWSGRCAPSARAPCRPWCGCPAP